MWPGPFPYFWVGPGDKATHHHAQLRVLTRPLSDGLQVWPGPFPYFWVGPGRGYPSPCNPGFSVGLYQMVCKCDQAPFPILGGAWGRDYPSPCNPGFSLGLYQMVWKHDQAPFPIFGWSLGMRLPITMHNSGYSLGLNQMVCNVTRPLSLFLGGVWGRGYPSPCTTQGSH